MKRHFELAGFTLTELLVTMTLFALVMTVVTSLLVVQMRTLQNIGRGRGARQLFWRHLEMVCLQTVAVVGEENRWLFETASGRMYEISQDPFSLREVVSGSLWQYPFRARFVFSFTTNVSQVVLTARLIGLSFDEQKSFILGWRKGER